MYKLKFYYYFVVLRKLQSMILKYSLCLLKNRDTLPQIIAELKKKNEI